MKPELVAVALVFLTIAAGAVLLWPHEEDRAPVVEALGGAQPDSAAVGAEAR
jgi:hypothetical protein